MYYWQKEIEEKSRDITYGIIFLSILCVFFVAGAFYVLAVSMDEVKEQKWVEYTVQPGDTLWGIAKEITHQPIDKTIHEIRKRNNIDPVIQPGQVLYVPKIATGEE